MRNLLEFLAKYNYWFIFIILEVIGISLLFKYNNYQNSVWFSSANYVSGKIYEFNSELESYISLKQINETLALRNVELESQINELSEKLYSATKDSSLSGKEQAFFNGFKLIPAKVINNTINRTDNLITLNKGTEDGVGKDMGVVCGTGVVGIIYLTSKHYSTVIPVLNTQSNISCKIKDRGYFGYLHWSGGSSEYAYVEDIPRHALFNLHEEVVTSGYSSVFPTGIQVGRINLVFNSPDGLSYRLKVKLSTDFSTLRDVVVLDNSAFKEQNNLQEAAKDSLKAIAN